MKYIHIPRHIIEATHLGRNRLLYFIYFALHRGVSDYIGFSVEDIMDWAKIKPNSCENGATSRTRSEIMNFITSLQDNSVNNLDSLKIKTYYRAYLPSKVFMSDNGFALITVDEINKIIRSTSLYRQNSRRRVSIPDLFSILAYLRVNTSLRASSDSACRISECCYRYYKTIAHDMDIPEVNISGLIDVLADMGIIVCVNPSPRKFSDGSIRTSCKYFADAYRYRKNAAGEYILDEEYSPYAEIERQMKKGIKT